MKQGVIAATLAVLIGFAGCSSTQVVRIGHAAPLTGGIAHLGNDNQQGAQLAIEELNAKGPRIAGQPVRFELVSEDDQADPRTAVAAAQRLVNAKVVAVVGHLNSGTSIPASQVYSQAGIPMITPSATNPRLTRRGLQQTFRLIGDDVTLGTVLAAHDPDVVFYGGLDEQAGPLLNEMQRQGMRARLMGGDGICSGNLARLPGGSLPDDRVWCAEAGNFYLPETPEGERFMRRFAERFSTRPILYSPYTYDAVQLFAKVMVDADSADPRVFTPLLAKTTGWQGITGPVSFDAKGDLVDAPITVFTYRGNLRSQMDIAR